MMRDFISHCDFRINKTISTLKPKTIPSNATRTFSQKPQEAETLNRKMQLLRENGSLYMNYIFYAEANV
jgi:hypothetical protein